MVAKRPRKALFKRRKKRKSNAGRNRRNVIGIIGLVFIVVGLTVAYLQFRQARKGLFHSFDNPVFSNKYFVRGVDVSHHNSFINWDRLRDNNITFVYLKSTEGTTHTDDNYKENYRLARNAGLKVGTYHFYTFGLDGKLQARHFIRSSKVLSNDLVPAIDVEHSAVNAVCRSKEARKKMLDELKKMETFLFDYYGKHPVIYTNKDCYKAYIESEFPENPLWICDLHNEPDVAADKWAIWQFSHTGNIDGVLDDIDLNYYRYSFSDFKHLLMP